MKFFEYFRYSMVMFIIQFNPFAWFVCEYDNEPYSDLYPGKFNLNIRFLMFRFSIHLDDGSY